MANMIKRKYPLEDAEDESLVTESDLEKSRNYKPETAGMDDKEFKYRTEGSAERVSSGLNANPHQNPVQAPKTEAQELDDLVKRYEAATQESADRADDRGFWHKAMASYDPAAAKVWEESDKEYINAPVAKIEGGQKAAKNALGIKKEQTDLKHSAEDDDPNSPTMSAIKSVYKQKLGIDIPDGVTPRQMKGFVGEIKLPVATESTEKIKGKEIEFKEGEAKRKQANFEAAEARKKAEEAGRNQRAKAQRYTSVILGSMAQSERSGIGAGKAAENASEKIGALPEVFRKMTPGNTRMVPSPGLNPSAVEARNQTELTELSSALVQSMQEIGDYLKENPRPTALDPKWASIASKYAHAVQRNIKAAGNGVANGPDVEQAIKELGDPRDIVTFIRGDLNKKLETAIATAWGEYLTRSESNKFTPSDAKSAEEFISKAVKSYSGLAGGAGGPVLRPNPAVIGQMSNEAGLPQGLFGGPRESPRQTYIYDPKLRKLVPKQVK